MKRFQDESETTGKYPQIINVCADNDIKLPLNILHLEIDKNKYLDRLQVTDILLRQRYFDLDNTDRSTNCKYLYGWMALHNLTSLIIPAEVF